MQKTAKNIDKTVQCGYNITKVAQKYARSAR